MQVMELAQQVMELSTAAADATDAGMHCRRNPSVLTACSSISSPASLSTVLSTAETLRQPGLLRATHTGFSLRDFSPLCITSALAAWARLTIPTCQQCPTWRRMAVVSVRHTACGRSGCCGQQSSWIGCSEVQQRCVHDIAGTECKLLSRRRPEPVKRP